MGLFQKSAQKDTEVVTECHRPSREPTSRSRSKSVYGNFLSYFIQNNGAIDHREKLYQSKLVG